MPFNNQESSKSAVRKLDVEAMAAETGIDPKEICGHLKIANPATLRKIEAGQTLEDAYQNYQEVSRSTSRNNEELEKATEKWRYFAKRELPKRIQEITSAKQAQEVFELCPPHTNLQTDVIQAWAGTASSLNDWEKLYHTLYPIHSREKLGDDLPEALAAEVKDKREAALNDTLSQASSLEQISQAYETFKRYSLKEWEDRAQKKWNEIVEKTIPVSLEDSSDEELSVWSKNLPKESPRREIIIGVVSERLLKKTETAPDLKSVWELAHNAPLSNFGATMHSIWNDRTEDARSKATTKEDWIAIVKYGNTPEKDMSKLAAFYKK